MLRRAKYFIAVLLFVSLASPAQDVKFTGTADKKFDGNQIVIYNRYGLHDSAIIKDGRFVFDVPFKEPGLYMFYSQLEMKNKGGYSPYGIMVTEPGTIKINADVENFSDAKVSGSKENDLYKKFSQKGNEAQQKIMDELNGKYGKEFVMNRNPDTSSARYKQLLKDYYHLSDSSQRVQVESLKQFIKANPGVFTSVFVLNNYATTMDLNELENLYASLSPKYKETKSGRSIASVIEARKITAIGKIAPDFTQPDTIGNAVKLSDFRGKYVLVDFWASWCGPCRAENPNLVKTFNQYKDKGFTVLGVSLDQPGKKEAWLAAIHKDELTWTQVSDLKFWDNKVAVLYGVKAIPANLLLDKEGKIIAKDLRGADLEKKLAEVIGE
jgi:peroxiredoxin